MTLISSHYRLLLHGTKSLFYLFWHHTYATADHKKIPVRTILSQLSLSLFSAAQTSCH